MPFVDSALGGPLAGSSCLVLSSSTFLLAQSTGGRILGRVADPSGAVLADVKVTLVNEATGVSREAQTNDSGDYVFVEVPARHLSRSSSSWPASRKMCRRT